MFSCLVIDNIISRQVLLYIKNIVKQNSISNYNEVFQDVLNFLSLALTFTNQYSTRVPPAKYALFFLWYHAKFAVMTVYHIRFQNGCNNNESTIIMKNEWDFPLHMEAEY